MAEFSTGHLLAGKLTYRQFLSGHRTGFEPVLLAAAVPAKPGERVLELGTGAGAALLCLAARVPEVKGIGIEIDPELAALANENFKINKLHDISCLNANAERLPFTGNSFDHAFANPPWFSEKVTAPPDAARALAHQAGPGLLSAWVRSAYQVLRPKGTITLILPAAGFATAAAAMRDAPFGGITLAPLWPRAGESAKMVILSGRKGSNGPERVRPGLVLHDEHGITPAANAILRDGAALIP